MTRLQILIAGLSCVVEKLLRLIKVANIVAVEGLGIRSNRDSCKMRPPPSPSIVSSDICAACGAILRPRPRTDRKQGSLEAGTPLAEAEARQNAALNSTDQSQTTHRNSSVPSMPADARPPQPRRPKTSPGVLRMRAERLAVRRAMVCQIPGINRVRAERIVAEYPTISSLLRVSVSRLERLKIKEAPLGHELAVALKRVFE